MGRLLVNTYLGYNIYYSDSCHMFVVDTGKIIYLRKTPNECYRLIKALKEGIYE